MRDAMDLLLNRLAKVIWNLSSFAIKWKGEHSFFFLHCGKHAGTLDYMQHVPHPSGLERGHSSA